MSKSLWLFFCSTLFSCSIQSLDEEATDAYFDEIDLEDYSWEVEMAGNGFMGPDSLGNLGVWFFQDPSLEQCGMLTYISKMKQIQVQSPSDTIGGFRSEFYKTEHEIWQSMPVGVSTDSLNLQFTRNYPQPMKKVNITIARMDSSAYCIQEGESPKIELCPYPRWNRIQFPQRINNVNAVTNIPTLQWEDSSIVITSREEVPGVYLMTSTLTGYSKSNEFIWESALGFLFGSLYPIADGAVVAGTYEKIRSYNEYSGQANIDSSYGVIARIDSQGRLLWKTKIDEEILHKVEGFSKIFEIGADSLVAFGFSSDERQSWRGILVVLFRPDGTILETKRFHIPSLLGTFSRVVSVEYQKGEFLVYCAENNQSQAPNKGVLFGFRFPN